MYRIVWTQPDGKYKAKARTFKQGKNLLLYLQFIGAKRIKVNEKALTLFKDS